MALPDPLAMTREIPVLIAEAGGMMDLPELERRITGIFWPQIHAVRGDDSRGYFKQSFQDAVTIAERNGYVHNDGRTLLLRGRGRAFAGEVMAQRRPGSTVADDAPAVIDLSNAATVIEYRFERGTLAVGYLRPDAHEKFHGKPMTMSQRELVDALYSAEINGEPQRTGFATALLSNGSGMHLGDLLTEKCHVRLPGLERGSPRAGVNQKSRLGGRRVGGISWPSILCEVIFELGGYADWPAIAVAVEKRGEAEADYMWREQCLQALRTHRMPSGKAYFEVADTGGAPAFALTERGRKVVKKRSQDDRAPSLSKYLVRAVHAEGDDKLTDLELYTMLFLATRLGRAKDATVIYHRLPENFPDEDHYAMIPLWINEAKRMTQDDD